MAKHEQKEIQTGIDILIGLSRKSQGGEGRCIRMIDYGRRNELDIFEARLKIIGGYWRIHKTVNARSVEKACRYLMKKLIDHPEKCMNLESEWRTALLQTECIYGKKKFMLDVDTKNDDLLTEIYSRIRESKGQVLDIHESPKGWHIITTCFDTREVCKLEEVTLIRDGYYFIKEVEEE